MQFKKYLELLQKLHDLIAGDSELADLYRDQMDQPWYDLSEAERLAVWQNSIDLYKETEDKIMSLSLIHI